MMSQKPDTTERSWVERAVSELERTASDQRTYRALEAVSIAGSVAALLTTYFLIGRGAVEANPVTGWLLSDPTSGSSDWYVVAIVGLLAVVASFEVLRRARHHAPRYVLAVGTLAATVHFANGLNDLYILSVAWSSVDTFPWWNARPFVAFTLLLAVGLATRHVVFRALVHARKVLSGRGGRAIALVLLIALSAVAIPIMGSISPEGDLDGTVSAKSEDGSFTLNGTFTHTDSAMDNALDRNGNFYTGDYGGNLYKLNSTDMTQKDSWSDSASNAVYSVYFDSGYIYAGMNGGSIHKIDSSTMGSVGSVGTTNRLLDLVVGPDGYLYAAEYSSGTIYKIDPSDMSVVTSATVHSSSVNGLTVGPNGYLFSVGDGTSGDTVKKLDRTDLSQVGGHSGHTSHVNDVDSDDQYIYTGSNDNEVHKIDPTDMSQVSVYTHADRVESVLIGEDGFLYAGTGNAVGIIHRVDPSDMTKQDSDGSHTSNINALSMDSDGYLFSSSTDNDDHRLDPGTTVTDPLSGTVTDKDGNALEGVAVGADHSGVDSTTTNSTGYYELAVPEAGSYEVTADSGDYVSTKTVDVPDGGISGVDFALGPSNPDGQPVGLLEDDLGFFTADQTNLIVYERSTEYKSVEEGMSVRTWHEETWTKKETATFNWENRTRVGLVDGRYYRLELVSSHGHWEDSGFLYNDTEMSGETIWLEPDTSSTDTNGDGTSGGDGSSGGDSWDNMGTPTPDENGDFPTATEQQGFGPTALGKCTTLDGQDGVDVEYWDPDYETAELEANLTVDDSTTYYIHKIWDDPRGYYRGCIADSMTDNASSEADVGLNHTALDGEGEVLTSGRQSFSAPTFGPSGKAPASTAERAGLLAAVLGALGVLWFGGNRYVPASSVRSWPSESISPAFGVGAPIVAVLGLDLAGGGVISAGVATGLAQIAPFAGIVGVTVGGYAILRWIRAPPSS